MDGRLLSECGIHAAHLFDPLLLSHFLADLEADIGWESARVATGRGAARRGRLRPNVRQAEVNYLAGLPEVMACFKAGVRQHLVPLLQEAYQTRIALPMECSAVRYGPGGHFQVHVDNGEGLEHRAFSVVCYLNDGLTGGETHFPDLELAVRPSAGLAIAFPSGYRHAALPVMAGMKYVLVCWLAGAPAVKWI